MNILKFTKSIASFFLLFSFFCVLFAQNKTILDSFEGLSQYKINASDQVDIKLSIVPGFNGNCLKIDYNFVAGSGYGGIQANLPISLPSNYAFSFYIKGESPNNTLEFKLIDKSGDNVWWVNNRNYNFPQNWTKLKFTKRNISKAWGPLQLDKPNEIDKVEFIITSVNGGKGSVYLDLFEFETREPIDTSNIKPLISSSTTKNIDYVFDSNLLTSWKCSSNKKQSVLFDFKKMKEFGGLVIIWDSLAYSKNYVISISNNNKTFDTIYTVKNGSGNKSFIPLKECEAKYLKLELLKDLSTSSFGIKEIQFLPLEFSDNANNMFKTIAKHFPYGYFPKYFYDIASYFTVSGVLNDTQEALINEEGQVELEKNSFSIIPSLSIDKNLYTWDKVKCTQTLQANYLPIQHVLWTSDKFNLKTTLFSTGIKDSSQANIVYTIFNTSNTQIKGKLNLSVLPFKVNPSYQFLNITGGAGRIESIKQNDNNINVNSNNDLFVYPTKFKFSTGKFNNDNIYNSIINNTLSNETTCNDQSGFAYGNIQFDFDLAPNDSVSFYIAAPYHKKVNIDYKNNYAETFNSLLNNNTDYWHNLLDRLSFKLPKSADKLINSMRSILAYILINQDNFGFQPGSRSYERSWIRDGSMTSSTLLKLGISNEVKDYIKWYSTYQFPDGKIPCVVDYRGPDPVPENDSHGQFIFAVYQYFLFTKDTSFLKEIYPKVEKTVDYIEHLISLRSTDEYATKPELKKFYGLVPESISHEGYSDKPMHSYWDNFYILKGLKDAVQIAKVLKSSQQERYYKLAQTFKTNLYNSIALVMKEHNINYIPGCAEKGDFDATSTTIALYPCNEINNLPLNYLHNTFNQYFDYFTERRDNPNFNWDVYTPYEIRTAGAFLFLDEPEKTYQLLDFFFKDQTPENWNQWAEVVCKNKNTPRFIGDMPHTWVGSDFLTVARSIFVYENESDTSLVVGAGLKKDWIDDPNGIEINKLRTYYGLLNYSINKLNNKYLVKLSGDINLPTGNIIIKNFNESKLPKSVTINGTSSTKYTDNSIVVDKFPAVIEIEY